MNIVNKTFTEDPTVGGNIIFPLWLLITVFVIIIIALCIWFYFQKKKENHAENKISGGLVGNCME